MNLAQKKKTQSRKYLKKTYGLKCRRWHHSGVAYIITNSFKLLNGSSQITMKRKKREEWKDKKRKKKTLKSHQNSNNNTTNTVKKISTRCIQQHNQQHNERSLTITWAGHTNRPKTSEPPLYLGSLYDPLWTLLVTFFDIIKCFYWDLFNNTSDFILKTLLCFWFYFYFFLYLHCNILQDL